MVDLWTADYTNFKWNRHDDHSFVVLYNNKFTLYGIKEGKDSESRTQDTELSDLYGTLNVEAVYPCDTHHHRKYKNFILHPSKKYDLITACQQKLYFIDLHKKESNDILNLNTDRRPAVKRINLLDWNHKSEENIALSIEKFRTAKGILIADITKASIIREFGSEGEGVQSMSWSPHNSDIIIAGISKKRLELFDMRSKSKDPGRKTNDIQEIDGVCFSPKNESIIASHSEEYIKIWDIRYLKNARPIHTIKSPTNDICKIEWCPTHSTRLSFITKAGKHLQILDFPVETFEKSDGEQIENQEHQQKQKGIPEMLGSTISNFSWHPHICNRILCCKKSVQEDGDPTYKLFDLALNEPIIAKFSHSDKLVWGCSETLADRSIGFNDIAGLIRQRISEGYGFDPTINKSIVKRGSLFALWSFFESVKKWENIKEDNNLKFKMGVEYLLKTGSLHSKAETMPNLPHPIVYTSPERNKCLETCGWPRSSSVHRNPAEFDTIVKYLLVDGEHDKAVAMYLFYHGIDDAIQCLQNLIKGNKGGDPLVHFALALSGFNGDQCSLWSGKTNILRKTVVNPYQRAMFTFLSTKTGEETAYKEILIDRQLLLEDRIAFACRFLPDERLTKYIGSLSSEETADGNLRAVVLTGVKYQLCELMQSYLDNTSDVQTVCLALTLARRYDTTQDAVYETDPTAIHTVVFENYLRFFDMRCMWIERALFQNERKKLLKNKAKVDQHLIVRCDGCSKSISDRPTQLYSNSVKPSRAVKERQSSAKDTHDKRFCPSNYCKYKLPRCALCMYNMGTTSRFLTPAQDKRSTIERKPPAVPDDNKTNPLKEWLVWCLVCQHGGHFSHVRDWFSQHKLCPTPGCMCNCELLDTTIPLEIV